LVVRGFIFKSPLGSLDLQIYFLIFFISSFICIRTLIKVKKIDSYQLELNQFKKISPGFFGLVVSYGTVFFLRQRSLGDAVSWIASGDSKNHLVNGASITQYGFLDPSTFLSQPVSSPTFLSLILSQDGKNLTSDGSTLGYQILIYTYVWALLIGILGLTFAATIETIWEKRGESASNTPGSLLAIASIIPTFSFILGPALYDGFFTALFGISALCVLTIWFIESAERVHGSKALIFVGFLIFMSSLMAWMFISALAFPLFILGARNSLRKMKMNQKKVDFVLISLVIGSALAIHFSNFGQNIIHQAKLALSVSGAVNATNPNLYLSLMIAISFICFLGTNLSERLKRSTLVILATHFVALFAFKRFSNLGITSWNYYLIKYQWIMFSALSAVLLSYFLVNVYSSFEHISLKRNSLIFLLILGIFLTSEALVPSNRVWQKIWRGWENPRNSTMNIVLEQKLDYKNPTMFFHYGYAGDGMLGNFWMNAYADPMEPIRGWNYTIDTWGDAKQLCDVNAYYPNLTVLTQDLELENELKSLCGEEKFFVKVIPSPF
jgi:hypothetical protein